MTKIFLISALVVASVSAAWVWNDEDYSPGHRIARNAFPIPQYPNLPGFPNLNFPSLGNFQNLMPKIQFPDIKSHNEKGFTGMSVVTSSDGTTTLVTNKDGVVQEYKVPKTADSKGTIVAATV